MSNPQQTPAGNPPPPTANPPPTAASTDVVNPPPPTAVTASAWTPRPRTANNTPNTTNNEGGGANPNRPLQNLYYFHVTYGPVIADFCRRFLTYSMITVLFLSSLYLLTWMIIGPTTPQFRLTSLSLSDLNSTRQYPSHQLLISSTFTAHFTAINPNARLHAHYDTFFTSVSYNSQLLAESRVPPFHLPTHGRKDVAVTLSASSANVDEWPAVVGGGDGGVIRFNLRIYVVIRLDAPLLVKDKGNWFGVYCDGLLVVIPPNATSGDMIGGARFCDVRPDVSERDFIRSKLN